MSAPSEPTRYAVCDGARVLLLQALPEGGYRFDPPPGEALDGRCERMEEAFREYEDEPPATNHAEPDRELFAAREAAATRDPEAPAGARFFAVRRGGRALILRREPADYGLYSVFDPLAPEVVTQGRTLAECFEMVEDARKLIANDAADRALLRRVPVGDLREVGAAA